MIVKFIKLLIVHLKTKYPIPIIGYDKEHCIEYIKRKFGKTLGDKKGLYCSLDGYKFEKWYYVK